jgi:hypothetical protein
VSQSASDAPVSVTPAESRVTLEPRGVTRPPRLGLLAASGVLLGLALALHREGLFGGPAFYERDTQLFYYPLASWVGQQLHAGVYPLWLPGIFTGYPIYADGELGLLYLPQVILLAVLPTPLAMVWLRVVHAFLAGLFMLLLLRGLRLSSLAALGGSLVFAFGSFLTAQMHHENVVRSSVWLPLIILAAERALATSNGRRRLAWLAVGALAYAQSAVGLHVQPVLMEALALVAYVAYRVVLGRAEVPRGAALAHPQATAVGAPRRRASRWLRAGRGLAETRLGRLVLASGAIGLGGLTIAAAQWLPLGEWALVSFRRSGVAYEFASAFGLAPENLPTLVFPFFFRLPDGATWWTLWQQWETELYVGIPTLALLLVGIVGSHRREVLFFLPLGAVALLIGMAHYAPVVNLHLLLWSVPGFSFLRAPGRFSYLVVFAAAGLAGLGLDALSRRAQRPRPVLALVGGVPAAALLVGLLILLPAWRARLLADPAGARTGIEHTYLAVRAQYPIDPDLVYRGLLASLDLANPKTAWSLVLLAATATLFAVWLLLGARRASVGQGLLVTLMAVDLLVFAADFHPRAPLASLRPAALPGVAPGQRVLLDGPDSLPEIQPNQLLLDDVPTVDGYSSLPSQRNVELLDQTQTQPALLDVWSARYIVEPTRPVDGHTAAGVAFRAEHPLAASFGGGLPSPFELTPDAQPSRAVRVIGTLSYAFDVPQGTTVGELSVEDASGVVALPLRAGVELAERAIDRPSLRGAMAHARPPTPTALDFEEATPEGEAYQAHLYLAELPLPRPMAVSRITLTAVLPKVLVEVHGLGLVAASSEAVRSLDLADRVGFSAAGQDDRHRVIEHVAALPRAFVVPRANAVSPGRHPDLTPVQIVASPDFDPRRSVLIEGDATLSAGGSQAGQSPPQPAEVVDLGPDAVQVRASLDQPGYLVLDDFYHRGWTARIDGQLTRVLIANAVFRGVALPPGQHTVEFRFEPLSHLVGAGVSAVALVVALITMVWGFNLARWDGWRARSR